jgi:hypothetical protein
MDGKVWASRTLMLPSPALTPEQRLLDVSLAEAAAKEGGSGGGAKPGLIGSKARSKIYRGYKCYYQIMENTGPSTVEISTVGLTHTD